MANRPFPNSPDQRPAFVKVLSPSFRRSHCRKSPLRSSVHFESRISSDFWQTRSLSNPTHTTVALRIDIDTQLDLVVATLSILLRRQPSHHSQAKMLSRSVRAVTGRALAASLRPVAIPVSRQLATPVVTQPTRRHYHEKVLDREYPTRLPLILDEAAVPSTLLTRRAPDYSRPRNVGTLDKSDKSVGEGLVGAPAVRDATSLQIARHALTTLTPTVRRCYAASYQGRPRDASHQRREVQDVRLRLCYVSALFFFSVPRHLEEMHEAMLRTCKCSLSSAGDLL